VIDDEVLRILQAVGLDHAALADAQVQPRASIVTADGRAVTFAPRVELSHYAYQWRDFAALGRVADRLKATRGRTCIWGPAATARAPTTSSPCTTRTAR
jgi:hypothetical protein